PCMAVHINLQAYLSFLILCSEACLVPAFFPQDTLFLAVLRRNAEPLPQSLDLLFWNDQIKSLGVDDNPLCRRDQDLLQIVKTYQQSLKLLLFIKLSEFFRICKQRLVNISLIIFDVRHMYIFLILPLFRSLYSHKVSAFYHICSYFFFKFRKIIFFLISAASSQFLHKINTRKLELRVKQRLLFFRKRREIRFFYNLF